MVNYNHLYYVDNVTLLQRIAEVFQTIEKSFSFNSKQFTYLNFR